MKRELYINKMFISKVTGELIDMGVNRISDKKAMDFEQQYFTNLLVKEIVLNKENSNVFEIIFEADFDEEKKQRDIQVANEKRLKEEIKSELAKEFGLSKEESNGTILESINKLIDEKIAKLTKQINESLK